MLFCCAAEDNTRDAAIVVDSAAEAEVNLKVVPASAEVRRIGDMVRVVAGDHIGRMATITEVAGNWTKLQFSDGSMVWNTRPSYVEPAWEASQGTRSNLIGGSGGYLHRVPFAGNTAARLLRAATTAGPLVHGLKLIFRTVDTSVREIIVRQRPLDMSFDRTIPVVVTKVCGHAKEVGVQVGWTLCAFDGRAVESNFHVFLERFAGQLARLPTYEMPMNFLTTEGGLKTVTARRRPLGLSFHQDKMPLVVTKVEGHARELGIREDWILKSFDGEEAVEDYKKFMDRFQSKLFMLPS
jgi:hypothetical protein